MKFTVQQKVICWQQFDIEADSRKDAIAKVTEDPTCGSMDNDGIETLYESEQVLTTVVYEENATDKDPILTLRPSMSSEAAVLH